MDTACTHSGTNKEQPVFGNLENLGVPVVDDSPFSTHSGTNKEQPVSGNLENLGVAVVDDSPFSILLVGS